MIDKILSLKQIDEGLQLQKKYIKEIKKYVKSYTKENGKQDFEMVESITTSFAMLVAYHFANCMTNFSIREKREMLYNLTQEIHQLFEFLRIQKNGEQEDD